ncbi:MAG: FAD-dependent oxidoreductase, partial [Candidatus Velthaea sp.]
MAGSHYQVAVVGGGHNGLVAAAYCARAGLRTVVLERRPVVGGASLSAEVWPGYTVSVAAYVCSLFDPRIAAELDLAAHGFEVYRKEPASFTPLDSGRSLLLGADEEAVTTALQFLVYTDDLAFIATGPAGSTAIPPQQLQR